MKAGHRKELQTNVLADRMGKFFKSVGSNSNANTTAAWSLILLALLTFTGWLIAQKWADGRSTGAWLQINDHFNDPGQLAQITSTQPATFAARTARFQAARAHLHEGLTRLFTRDHPDAVAKIKLARQQFADLLPLVADNPSLQLEALLAIARAEEALVGAQANLDALGDIDRAIAYYRRVADRYPDFPEGKEAAQRAEHLNTNRQAVQDFYDKMYRQAETRARTLPPLPPIDGLPALDRMMP